jgi:hypothetical protein
MLKIYLTVKLNASDFKIGLLADLLMRLNPHSNIKPARIQSQTHIKRHVNKA